MPLGHIRFGSSCTINLELLERWQSEHCTAWEESGVPGLAQLGNMVPTQGKGHLAEHLRRLSPEIKFLFPFYSGVPSAESLRKDFSSICM